MSSRRTSSLNLGNRLSSMALNFSTYSAFSSTEENPFVSACRNGRVDLVRGFLEKKGISLGNHMVPGSTPFLIACQTGQAEVVALLLGDARIDVNQSDEQETTPLWAAAAGGYLLVVQLILASGRRIDVGRRERDSGKTAVEKARANGARAKRVTGETEEDFQRIRENCPKIAELIEKFEEDQVTTRKQLRWKLDLEATWLEEHLGVQLPTSVSYTPIESQEPEEVETLSLADSALTSLPHKLVAFKNLKELDLSSNPLDDSTADVVSHLLTHLPSLCSLNLAKTLFTQDGLLAIFQALAWNFSQGIPSLKSLVVEDMKFESYAGLQIVPRSVLEQGTQKTAEFMLSLFDMSLIPVRSLVQSKVIVMGPAGGGKTSLLECIYPISEVLFQREEAFIALLSDKFKWVECTLTLSGNRLTQSDACSPVLLAPSSKEKKRQGCFGTVSLSKAKGWRVEEVNEHEKPGFRITGPDSFASELFCNRKLERDSWVARIRRVLENKGTPGLEVRTVSRSLSKSLKTSKAGQPEDGQGVQLSLWDFSGASNYANLPHYFLSSLSVMVLVWNLAEFDEGDHQIRDQDPNIHLKGLRSLRYWMSFISMQLRNLENQGEPYTTMVVGTHADQLHPQLADRRSQRLEIVRGMCSSYRLQLSHYAEVSCVDSLSGIESLNDVILRACVSLEKHTSSLSLIYDSVGALHQSLLAENQNFPVVDIKAFDERFPKSSYLRLCLTMLQKKGKCVFVSHDSLLGQLVVLDPQFLGTLMAGFASQDGPAARSSRDEGIIHHQDLAHLWRNAFRASTDFWALAERSMALLEKFGISFVLPEDAAKPFVDRKSYIPSLLPRKTYDRMICREIASIATELGEGQPMLKELLAKKAEMESHLAVDAKWSIFWPDEAPSFYPSRFVRVLQVASIPAELFPQLIASLRLYIEGDCVMKDQLLLRKDMAQARVTYDQLRAQFIVEVRAGSLDAGEELVRLIKDKFLAILFQYPFLKIVVMRNLVQLLEGVRSPYSDQIIPLELIKNASSEESIVWETDPPVRAALLKELAGVIPRKPAHKTPLLQGSSPRWSIFISMFTQLGGDLSTVAAVYDVESSELRALFERSQPQQPLNSLTSSTPNDTYLKQGYYHHLRSKYREFSASPLLEGEKVAPTLAMVHGTTEPSAWRVASEGFGIVSTVDDGAFGRGVYFTSRVDHASRVVSHRHSAALVIALVEPGAIFPVTGREDLRGRKARPGYQSHYCVVGSGLQPSQNVFYDSNDELVVFELAQALPLFIVTLRK